MMTAPTLDAPRFRQWKIFRSWWLHEKLWFSGFEPLRIYSLRKARESVNFVQYNQQWATWARYCQICPRLGFLKREQSRFGSVFHKQLFALIRLELRDCNPVKYSTKMAAVFLRNLKFLRCASSPSEKDDSPRKMHTDWYITKKPDQSIFSICSTGRINRFAQASSAPIWINNSRCGSQLDKELANPPTKNLRAVDISDHGSIEIIPP